LLLTFDNQEKTNKSNSFIENKVVEHLHLYTNIPIYIIFLQVHGAYLMKKHAPKKYFFDELTCHYYLFDGLEFSHIQQYKYTIISNKHVRHVYLYNNSRIIKYHFPPTIVFKCVCVMILRRTIITVLFLIFGIFSTKLSNSVVDCVYLLYTLQRRFIPYHHEIIFYII